MADWSRLTDYEADASRCASARCDGNPKWRFEAGQIGSTYCQGCKDQIDDQLYQRRRAERRAHMQREMERAMADAAELSDYIARHPLPWTWSIAYHDGWFYQLHDANGAPCLGDDLRDAEDAASLLAMINRTK